MTTYVLDASVAVSALRAGDANHARTSPASQRLLPDGSALDGHDRGVGS